MRKTIYLSWLLWLVFFSTIFLFKLDYTVLLSYDEAWYAEIARNVVLSKNPLVLTFNGTVFTDHPPFGYLLMALPTWWLGSNELSARLASAVLGTGAVAAIFLLGKRLKNTAVGVIAAAVLVSSLWFMLRARTGNLDVPLVFWEIVTLLVVLSKSRYFLYLTAVSFAALILTKTLVGVGLLPVLILIVWLRRREFTRLELLKSLGLVAALILPWYVYNQWLNNNFLYHHFFEIGTRGQKNEYGLVAIESSLNYLAIGMGKWYKVFLIVLPTALLSFWKQKQQRLVWIVLTVWLAGFAALLISSQTEIWHLLPLYPIVAIGIGLALVNMRELVLPNQRWLEYILVLGCLGLAGYQFSQLSNLLYPPEPTFSAERDIAIRARGYQPLYLMETFYPAAVYYSQHTVRPLYWEENAYQTMTSLLDQTFSSVFIVNEATKTNLERDRVPFVVIDQNQSYFLIQ